MLISVSVKAKVPGMAVHKALRHLAPANCTDALFLSSLHSLSLDQEAFLPYYRCASTPALSASAIGVTVVHAPSHRAVGMATSSLSGLNLTFSTRPSH